MTLADVAVELYAVPPGGFVAARTARVKQLRADGDRELAAQVAALRKPTLAAWAVDLLVRHRPADVEALLALGAELRGAQASLAGAELRELDRRRHALMAGLRAEAHALAAEAGQPLADAVDVPLDGTLRAAMTDDAAAAAVRSGLLVQDLTSTGFEPVDVTGAVALPDAPPLPGTSPATGTGTAPGTAAATPSARAGEPADDDAVALPRRRGAGARTASRPGTAARSRAAAPARTAAPGGTPRPAGTPSSPRTTSSARTAEDLGAGRRAEEEREAARRREREAAEQDLAAAQARSADADRALAAARAAVGEAVRRRADLASEVERLAAELGAAQAAATKASVDERHARTARDTAAEAAGTARKREQSARERLDRLG